MKIQFTFGAQRVLTAGTTAPMRVIVCFSVFFLACFSLIPPAHADGGAPNLAYIAGTPDGITVIDVAQRRISRTMNIAGAPRNVLLSLDGSLIYTAQPLQGRVSILEAATGKTRCSSSIAGQPSVLALSPQNDVFYTAGSSDTRIHVLDAKTCAPRATFQAPGPVHALATSFFSGAFPTHRGDYQLWVATAGKISVFDTDGTQLANFTLAADPQAFCIPPGIIVYVTTGEGTVVALDLSTMRFTAPLLRGGPFGTMDYDAATGEIYIPEQAQQQIAVLAPVLSGTQIKPGKLARQLHLPGVPQAVAITSDGQLGFVTLQDGRVVMMDIPARQVANIITVGGHPHSVITGLYPPLAIVSQGTTPQAMDQQQPPWRNGLFLVFVTISVLALLSLIAVILLWRRTKPR